MNARSLSLAALLTIPALPAWADNQVVNSGFVSDLGGWTLLPNAAYTLTHTTSQSFFTPGSLRVQTSTATAVPFVVARQCLTVSPGQVMDFGVKARHESGHASAVRAFAGITWFDDGACTTGALSGPSTAMTGPAPDTWNGLHANDVVVPAGRNSVLFFLAISIVTGEGVAYLDDAYFGPDPLTPVELLSLSVE